MHAMEGCSSECHVALGEVIESSYDGSKGQVIEHLCPITCVKTFELIDREENSGKTFLVKRLVRGVEWPEYTFRQQKIFFGFLTPNVIECERLVQHFSLSSRGSWFFSWETSEDESLYLVVDRPFHIFQLLTLFNGLRVAKFKRSRRVRFKCLPSCVPGWSIVPQWQQKYPDNLLFWLEELYFDCDVDNEHIDLILWMLKSCARTVQKLKIRFNASAHMKFVSDETLFFPKLRFLDDSESCTRLDYDLVTRRFPVLEHYKRWHGEDLVPRSVFQNAQREIVYFEGANHSLSAFMIMNQLRSRDAHRVFFYLKPKLGADIAKCIAHLFFRERISAFQSEYVRTTEYAHKLRQGNEHLILLPQNNIYADEFAKLFDECQHKVTSLTQKIQNMEKAKVEQSSPKKRKKNQSSRLESYENELFRCRLELDLERERLESLWKTVKNKMI